MRWGIVGSVLVITSLLTACDSPSTSTRPHGNPDPGGTRLARLESVAHQAMPTEAVSVHYAVTKSSWNLGGCDGGPAGWTSIEVVGTFTVSGSPVAEVTASMRHLGWVVVPQVAPSAQGGFPAPAEGPTYAGEFEPVSKSDHSFAWLFAPGQAGWTAWTLDLMTPPAELPAAIC